jgi:ribosome recycling factor
MLYDEKALQSSLDRIVENFKDSLKKIRTGRATMELFNELYVEVYGSKSKLSAVANIVIEDALNVKINVWDKNILSSVEESLRGANLGASIIMERDHIRLKFSPLTEETRVASIKELRKLLEEFRIKVRQVRQEFIKKIESLDGVSEDEQRRDEKAIQEKIDECIDNLDNIAKKKENAIMTL